MITCVSQLRSSLSIRSRYVFSPIIYTGMSVAHLHTLTIPERIAALQTRIKELKISKQDATEEVNEMKLLKEQLGKDKAEGSTGGFQLKTPKGTIDHKPEAALLRKKIFGTLESIFVKYGGSTIDTPVFELREILAGKYGEDSKLIYDLQDQGGELCSLRYDLTVPFARYLAMNGITSMKRYHIGKVYRRDQPVMSKGRMREFYQCDFDIAGIYDSMVPDAEILSVLCEALTALEIGEFTVKVNHRKILDGILALAGVSADKTRAISSSIDKLDKSPWSEVKREMTDEKGLTEDQANRIGEYVGLKGPGFDLLAKLEGDEILSSVKSAKEGMVDMRKLFEYLEVFGVLEKMSFDMSLARGLDYYTGIIYEAITQGSAPQTVPPIPPVPAPSSTSNTIQKDKKSSKVNGVGTEDGPDETTVGVGSIAGGGRYDNLVGMFSEAAGGKRELVPCVGVSVGVERVYSILESKRQGREQKARGKETEVYIMNFGKEGLLKERMGLAKRLRENGIKAEYMYKESPKDRAQLSVVDHDQIPFVAILAPAELKAGTVRIKAQIGKEAAGSDRGEEVPMTEVVEYLKGKLRKT